MIITQMLSLSMKILHPSLVIEVLLTSSFLLIFRLLGLHASSDYQRKPLASLDLIFD